MKYKMCVHECTNRKRIFFKFSCLFFVKYLKIYNTKKYKNVFIKSSYVFFHEWNILKKISRMTNFDKSVKLHLAKSANEFFRKIVDATIIY